MALMECPECGRSISDQATSCPQCGYPVARSAAPGSAPAAGLADERHILTRRPVMFRNHPVLFLAMLACVALAFVFKRPELAVPLVVLLLWWIKCLNTELVVTTLRTRLRKGILGRRTVEVRHRDVRSLDVKAGSLQRMFSVGTVAIGTGGGDAAAEIRVSGIVEPEEVISSIRELQ